MTNGFIETLDWLEMAEIAVEWARDHGDEVLANESPYVIARIMKADFTCFYEQFDRLPDDAEELRRWRRDTPEGQWATALGERNDPPRRQ
jgi:hypothetical protein